MDSAVLNEQIQQGVPQWYAIQTRPRHEKRVAERLRSKAVEAFLPTHHCRHRWNNGVLADIELPLFPSYLFVRTLAHERVGLLQLPGIVGIAASNTHPTAIPDAEIETLRLVTSTLSAEPYPYLKAGDRVRIVAGPLAGMEGILVRRKHLCRLILTIETIMRSIAVEVSEFDIEVISSRRSYLT
jgi:transcription antitermination factor NusG